MTTSTKTGEGLTPAQFHTGLNAYLEEKAEQAAVLRSSLDAEAKARRQAVPLRERIYGIGEVDDLMGALEDAAEAGDNAAYVVLGIWDDMHERRGLNAILTNMEDDDIISLVVGWYDLVATHVPPKGE